MRAPRRAPVLMYASVLLVRWRILTDEPHASERDREASSMACTALFHGDACTLTTREQLGRMTAAERIAADRRRARRLAQQLRDCSTRADEDAPARRLEPYAVAYGAWQKRAEARPSRCRLDRVVGNDEHFFQPQCVDVRCAPESLGRELFNVLDAPLGHLLRRQAHHLEARRAAGDLARQNHERLRLEAVRRKAPMLAFGVGCAEAGEVHAVVAPHERPHALRGGRRL